MIRWLVILAVAWAVIVAALYALMAAYLPGVSLAAVFLSMGPVSKLCFLMTMVVSLLGIIGGLSRSVALTRIASGLAVVLGLLGAAYSELMSQMAIAAVGPVSFAVTAPGRVEVLLCLAVGLGGALISLGLLHLPKGRPAPTP